MRLIDADKLMWRMGIDSNDRQIFFVTGKDIDEQPTIEAAPVVHGRWKYVEVIGFGFLSTCSECGHHDHETNYCPNCGAKMDGGISDG